MNKAEVYEGRGLRSNLRPMPSFFRFLRSTR